jgi:hypothetical protein
VLEVAGGILLGVLILVYFGRMRALAAGLFGGILIPAAAALVHLLRFDPIDVAIGVVVAAVVLGSIQREAREDEAQQQGRRA